MNERIYRVPEVSCQHCVQAITGELTKISGVQSVEVNLASKTVTVRHEERVTDDQLRAGITEAGFDIAA